MSVHDPQPLTKIQLELVVHVANGLRHDEIAETTHRSLSSVKKTLATAQSRAGARTLAHLVSIVIAQGLLEWIPDEGERQIQEGPALEPAQPG